MAIHLSTEQVIYEIGTSDFFRSFFDTIDYQLTRGIFGKKYPFVLGEFQQGTIKFENLEKAENELKDIQKRFSKLKPYKVIWDKYDLAQKPPWGDNISRDITDLSNYFVTSDGVNLFETIFKAIEQAKSEKSDVKIC